MTILILIIGISALILIHEFGHFIASKMFGRWVEEFGIGFPPRLWGKKIGETIYSINALPFGGFVKIHGERPEGADGGSPHVEGPESKPERSFARLSVGKRAAIIVAGVVMNFLLGWLLISLINFVGTPSAVVVTGVGDGSPAAVAGIASGDRIIGYDTTQSFIEAVGAAKGNDFTVRLERNGKEEEVTAVPRVNPPEGEGALGVTVTDIGSPQMPFFQSIGNGFIVSLQIMGAIFVSIGNLIVGLLSGAPAIENFVGPVGIFKVADQTAQFGIIYLIQLIALISLNLAALNLIPIPALDGGRLLFLAIEKIKGSPIPPKREGIANTIGFGLLIFLMVAITVHDVIKLF